MKKLALVILPLVLLIGCAKVSQSNLYWGDYSSTLYKVKKEPSVSSKLEHENELQEIVEKSKSMHLKVPPGIYAELGVFAKDKGKHAMAKAFFKLEQETYPESEALMKRAMQNNSKDNTI